LQILPDSYLIEIARQFALLSAFLGGFTATFLATLLFIGSSKRIADWVVGSAAAAACSFIVGVIASVMLTIVLHPDAPENVIHGSSVDTARVVSSLGFGFGVFALLVSIGLSDWIRSRKSGIATSAVSFVGLFLVTWALTGFN